MIETVRIDFDVRTAALDRAATQLQNMNTQLQKIGTSFKNVGRTMTLGMTIPIIGLLGKSAMLASDLQESANVVNTTFKESSKEVTSWAGNLLENFGIVKLEAMKYSGAMGAMLKSSGISAEATKEMSMRLVELTGDMSSFYNLSHEEMWTKIQAGISGETEPLKRLGVNMSVANLEAFALSEGINKAWKEMSQAEQVTLRYNYLMKVTKDSQGDFAKTSDSFANQLKILQGQMTNLGESIGMILLPYLNKAAHFVNQLAARFMSLSEPIKKIILAIALVAATIGPVLLVVGTLITSLTSIIGVIGAVAGAFSGVLIPIAAIAAAIAGLIALIATMEGINLGDIFAGIKDLKFEDIQAKFENIVPVIKDITINGIDKLTEAMKILGNIWDEVSKKIKEYQNDFETLKDKINGIIDGIIFLAFSLTKLVVNLQKVGNFLWNIFGEDTKKIIREIADFFKTNLFYELDNMKNILYLIGYILQGDFKNAWSKIIDIISVKIDQLMNALYSLAEIVSIFWNNHTKPAFLEFEVLLDSINTIWEAIRKTAIKALTGIFFKVVEVIQKIKEFKDALTNSITGGGIFNFFKNNTPFNMYANGGYSSGGMALVGENGPELVNLPQGARVYSNTQTTNILNNGVNDVNMNVSGQITVNTTQGIFQLNRSVIEKIVSQAIIDNVTRFKV